jgi:hypothetical protein
VATITATPTSGKVSVAGSGYTGAIVYLVTTFVASDNKRRSIETQIAPVSGGGIAADVAMPFTGGTIVVRVLDAAHVVQATSSSTAV